MKKVFVGIDMGATHIRICVMDEHHQILSTDYGVVTIFA